MGYFTKSFHRTSYPAINPSRPELSQAKRTVLITGASGGIGASIAKAFADASAARVIIAARRPTALAEVKAEIEAKHGSKTEVLAEVCDASNFDSIKGMWKSLAERGIEVDVLVLNAAVIGETESMLREGADEVVMSTYMTNVLGPLVMARKFLKQGKEGKALINVSSIIAHLNPVQKSQLCYATTKASNLHLLQMLAYEVPVEECQILSYHPGTFLTPGGRGAGLVDDHPIFRYDPRHYAVWAASKDAAFLHGRYTWSYWDVDELKAMPQIHEDAGFLKMGLQGPTRFMVPQNLVEDLYADDDTSYPQ